MTSGGETSLATSAGWRQPPHSTRWPSRTRAVSTASADRLTNASNVISSVGTGSVWTWSNSHTESKPSASASCATATVRAHARDGSQPSYSPVQPWGARIPTRIRVTSACLAALEDRARLVRVVHDEGEGGAVAPAADEQVAQHVDAGVRELARDLRHAARAIVHLGQQRLALEERPAAVLEHLPGRVVVGGGHDEVTDLAEAAPADGAQVHAAGGHLLGEQGHLAGLVAHLDDELLRHRCSPGGGAGRRDGSGSGTRFSHVPGVMGEPGSGAATRARRAACPGGARSPADRPRDTAAPPPCPIGSPRPSRAPGGRPRPPDRTRAPTSLARRPRPGRPGSPRR